jgi:copper resistance protein D
MDWFGAGNDWPLIAARAIHFAATAITAGNLVFTTAVAGPALRGKEAEAGLFRAQTRVVAWLGLAIVLISGAIWFLLQAAAMAGVSIREGLNSEVLSTVVNETQFGQVCEIRLALTIVLAASLAARRQGRLVEWLALACAIGVAMAIAWTGHAAGTLGGIGYLHLTADGLHVVAASAWIGGLVSLVLLLWDIQHSPTVTWASCAETTVRRFSILGIISVATLLVTGTINAWILVGSFEALLVTEYGRILTLKIIAFAVMLAFATFNRLWLMPRLVSTTANQPQIEALRQLTRNSAIEIALGFAIFAMVGILGTMHPAIHFFL